MAWETVAQRTPLQVEIVDAIARLRAAGLITDEAAEADAEMAALFEETAEAEKAALAASASKPPRAGADGDDDAGDAASQSSRASALAIAEQMSAFAEDLCRADDLRDALRAAVRAAAGAAPPAAEADAAPQPPEGGGGGGSQDGSSSESGFW